MGIVLGLTGIFLLFLGVIIGNGLPPDSDPEVFDQYLLEAYQGYMAKAHAKECAVDCAFEDAKKMLEKRRELFK